MQAGKAAPDVVEAGAPSRGTTGKEMRRVCGLHVPAVHPTRYKRIHPETSESSQSIGRAQSASWAPNLRGARGSRERGSRACYVDSGALSRRDGAPGSRDVADKGREGRKVVSTMTN
ncbi:hypothetical protein HPB50_016655 [Hyalomma asiaticum]|uniref:Uncharacterized protein n=1 Tax=Hyalomma asiaticum TaxID=266040 RepID=A0ACB7TLI8_HYAAI|nr:hypothetical protein HPB50_016655 [Hyalomma asiaticum]